jgi:hypothetical protein
MLLVFSAAWQTFSEDATSLLAFCIEEKTSLQTSTTDED